MPFYQDIMKYSNFFADKNYQFLTNILNGMLDWVRVVDRNNIIIFANSSLIKGLGKNPVGEKCFESLGMGKPCNRCISKQAVFNGESSVKEEFIFGRYYSISTSPVKNQTGEIFALVEVLHDITEIKNLQSEIIEQNKKFKQDLSLAKMLQLCIMPENFYHDNIKFSYMYKPCTSIGGDFLNIFEIDKTHIGLYIADVSGHGIPAALLTIYLDSTLDKTILSPSKALHKLYNDFNSSNFESELYITIFYLVIDIKNHKICYSNAGHNSPPVLFNKNKFNILRISGIPISNWLENPNYENLSTKFESKDRLLLYTDGITEIRNSSNQKFGENKMLDIILNKVKDISDLNNLFEENINDFSASGVKQNDDITLALVEFN